MQFLSNDVPEKIAIKLGDLSITYALLEQKIERFSHQLQMLPKAILILQATPDIEFIIQLLAALKNKIPVALFANQWSEEEKQTRIAILGHAMTVNAQGELLEHYENNELKHHPQLALVLFTSGTTGQIKAVQLSEKNIKANCLAVIKALDFSKVQEQLLFLPLSYSFGLLGQLLPGLMTGLTTHLITQFTDIKTLLETNQVPQMWSGVPSHWVAINKMASLYPDSAAKIKAIISAGAPLSTSLRADLKHTFPNAIIYNNYGLTEAAPRVLTYSSDDPLFMEQYAGYPVGDWQIKLSEDQELLIHGSQTMLGYLGEEENSKVQNGWLYTGDIAEILPSGLVAIKGRRDNLINIGGEKVNLTEIEQKLCLLDEIKEIVLLPLEDALYGVRLLACLEKNMLAVSVTEQQLLERIQRHLLPRKLPISVRFLEKIPRNQHGKPDRKTLLLTIRSDDHKEKK
ncbi:class I adenylate-forming enzyme family protein [Legionella maioricensis]|uniref:Acyl--CoA ligase n=1 Tax=Legionella maioricensis TaxID=2896528 RepID=A0A9X2IBY4_9GAMM|nr:class I adenylate-forming enzyme family protein [Legionella maioricensis]MCL9684711.1 acyl--CoA ligase [Legionella maioricensis]MCL9687739.1 acyl--CoA ligase [Legionella maioricensis]